MNKNLWRTLQMIREAEPTCIPFALVDGLLRSALPLCNLIGSSILLDELFGQRRITFIIVTVALMLGINFVLMIIEKKINRSLQVQKEALRVQMEMNISEKAMRMSYHLLESPSTLQLIQKAREGQNGSGGIVSFVDLFTRASEYVFIIIESIMIMIPLLFSSGKPLGQFEEFLDSPLVFLVLLLSFLAMLVLHGVILKKQNQLEFQLFQDNVNLNRIADYYMNLCYFNYAAGKDIRLYQLQDLIYTKQESIYHTSSQLYLTYYTKRGKRIGFATTLNQIMNGLIYMFVAAKAFMGAISTGHMMRYIGAIAQLTTAIMELEVMVVTLSLQAKYFRFYADFLALPEEHETERFMNKDDFLLEFHDVSFTYPGMKEKALDHVSMKIRKNERIAVVGQNGAGKTTFIKLIARLYEPDEGYISFNGVDIRFYDFAQYCELLSVVFQDFHLLSYGVGENIAANKTYDEQRVWDCLKKVGMQGRVEKMNKGLETILYQNNEKGIEISGGEAQKLGIARAFYKDAPCIILDEPTAALDPISEYEIYKQFYELCEHKTSIFISHRMSSCRFAKRILVFQQGHIEEEGSHVELLEKNGLYSSLWNAQAQHYQKLGVVL